MEYKYCTNCGRTLQISEFTKDKNRKDGVCIYCKDCWNKNRKRYYKKRLYKDYKDYYDNWRKSLGGRYSRIKNDAINKRGKSFNISKQEYIDNFWDKKCIYCGRDSFGGIDRVDNNIGYEINNCVPCCWDCNTMKRTKTPAEFINDCRTIAKNNKYKYLTRKDLKDCSDLDTNEV